MLNPKKIFLLWLFLAIVGFLSCGDINDVIDFDLYLLPEQNIEVHYLYFVKFHFGSNFNSPALSGSITECMVGDSVALVCGIYGGKGAWDNFPISVVARLNTSKEKVRSVKLYERNNVTYSGELPPPPRQHIIYFPGVTSYNQYKETFLITQNTDVITATIKAKNQTLKATLNIRGDF